MKPSSRNPRTHGRHPIRKVWPFLFALLWLGLTRLPAPAQVTDLASDEELVLFPSVIHASDDRKSYEFEVHAWICEPERSAVLLSLLKGSLRLNGTRLTEAESATLAERARLFTADNQRGREVVIRVGRNTYNLGKTKPNGHVSRTLHLKVQEVDQAVLPGPPRTLAFAAVLRAGDTRSITGQARFLGDAGILVVSDIDDTIKISQVTHKQMLLRNTFLEPFRPAPGMATLYRAWADQHQAEFFYVSSSPWQLYPALSGFMGSNGFPSGVFCLKDFRLKDQSFVHLLESPEKHKRPVIERLLMQFPNHPFVLVGDSGESDPEIYGQIAREHSQRVKQVLIRDVTGQGSASERYQHAFRDLPPETWMIFREPHQVTDRLALP